MMPQQLHTLEPLEVQKYIEKLNFGARSVLGTIQCVECRLDCPLRDRDLHGFASCIRRNASGSKHLESRMGVNYVCDHWNSKTCYPKGNAFAESARHIRDMCSCLLSCWRFCWPSPLTWFGGSLIAPVRILWMSLYLQLQNGKMFNSWTLEAEKAWKSIGFSTERKYQRGCGLYMNYKPLPCPTNKQQKKSLARSLVFRISA